MDDPADLSLNSADGIDSLNMASLALDDSPDNLSPDLSANRSPSLDPSSFAKLPFELIEIIYELSLWRSLVLRDAGPLCAALEPFFERVRRSWLDQYGPRQTDFASEFGYARALYLTGRDAGHEMVRDWFSDKTQLLRDIHPYIAMVICCAGFNEPSVNIKALKGDCDINRDIVPYPFAPPSPEASSAGPSSKLPFVPFSTLWTPPSCPLLASITELSLNVGNQASFEVVGEPEAKAFGAYIQLMRMVPNLRSLCLEFVVHPSVTIALLQGSVQYALPHLVRDAEKRFPLCCIGDILRLVPNLRHLEMKSQDTDWASEAVIRTLQDREPLECLKIGTDEYSYDHFPGEEATRLLKLVETLGPDRMPRHIWFGVYADRHKWKVGTSAVERLPVSTAEPFPKPFEDWTVAEWMKRGYKEGNDWWWEDVVAAEDLTIFARIKDVVEQAGATFKCYLAKERNVSAASAFLQAFWQERRDDAYYSGLLGRADPVQTREENEGTNGRRQTSRLPRWTGKAR
ncbi:hypothetical protein AAT19DRAFT_16755 [Rhodotorula toruloides]|uniref:Uncharacterized protein n=1 Tax=Rhodotorula toruloides TaxID=5286 RepID=A0A2T0A491_RHOTO|nr:hypothetical protein AAT19DRAFT_16755 [Rhodotorula toruloides]